MLDIYVVPVEIPRHTVEKFFSDEVVSDSFNRLMRSKEFESYLEKIITKASVEAENQGIVFDKKFESKLKKKIKFIIKMNLYRTLIENAAREGELDRAERNAKLCFLMNMENIKVYLKPMRTKRFIKRFFLICK